MLPRKIINGIFSLQALKVFELIVPLLTLPLVIKSIGFEDYGYIAFSQVIAQYLIMVIEWGYSSSATKYLAIEKNIQIKKYFYLWSSFFKLLAFLIFTYPLCFVLKKNGVDNDVIIFTLAFVLFSSLNGIWVLQAEYKLYWQAIIMAIGRLVFLISVVLFNDSVHFKYIYLFTLYSPQFLMFIFSNLLILKLYACDVEVVFRDSFHLVSKELNKQRCEGWSILSYRLISSAANPFLVLMLNNYVGGASGVTILNILQKMNSAVTGVIMPVIQSAYPYMAEKKHEALDKYSKLKKKIYIILIFLSVSACSVLVLTSGYIQEYLNIPQSINFTLLVSIFCLNIPLSTLSSLTSHTIILGNMAERIKYATMTGMIVLISTSLFLSEYLDLLFLIKIYLFSQFIIYLILLRIKIKCCPD